MNLKHFQTTIFQNFFIFWKIVIIQIFFSWLACASYFKLITVCRFLIVMVTPMGSYSLGWRACSNYPDAVNDYDTFFYTVSNSLNWITITETSWAFEPIITLWQQFCIGLNKMPPKLCLFLAAQKTIFILRAVFEVHPSQIWSFCSCNFSNLS